MKRYCYLTAILFLVLFVGACQPESKEGKDTIIYKDTLKELKDTLSDRKAETLTFEDDEPAPNPLGDPMLIRLKLPVGANFMLKETIRQEVAQKMLGALLQNINLEFHVTYEFQVLAHKQNNMVIKVVIKRIVYNQEAPGTHILYDSDKPTGNAEELQLSFLSTFVGENFTMEVSPLGEIIVFSGMEHVWEKIFKEKGITDKATQQSIRHSLNGQFDDKSFKANFSKLLAIYPDEPVRVNERWERDSETRMGITLFIKSRFSLQDVTGDSIVLKQKSMVVSDPNMVLDMVEAKISADIKGIQKGWQIIDRQDGLLRKSELVQILEGEMTVDMPGQPKAMQMPVRINNTITRKVIKQ